MQWPKEKGYTTIFKTLHKRLKIDQHDSTKNRDGLKCSGTVNST
jgi:hypothetical protein